MDEDGTGGKIMIRGRVPRGFFAWFQARQRSDRAHHEMLKRCFFEER